MIRFPGRRRPAPTLPSAAELARRIAGYPVISCDIFETAVLRHLARPEDALLALGLRARARGLIACPPEVFREGRLEAERAARAEAEAAGHDEVRLAEIYDRLRGFCLVETEADATALAELEFALERTLCVAAEPLRSVLAARAPGQRLVFVSDTILPGPWLATLLQGCGYGEEPVVFSSADARRSKHTGRLFVHVLERLGRAPNEILHLGDNPQSDVVRAWEHGIAALHLPRPNRPPEPDRLRGAHVAARLVHSHRRSLATLAAPPAGGAAGAPMAGLARYVSTLLIGYTLSVLDEARRRGIRRIYFLARDGHLPLVIARRLAARLPDPPDLVYLHVSRRAITVPALANAPGRLCAEAMQAAAGQPLSALLDLFDIPTDTTLHLLHGLGLDPAARIGREAGQAEAERLLAAAAGPVGERLATLHGDAMAYLDRMGFLAPGPRLVVDVGWRGTTQAALCQLTGLPATAIIGCYLGLWPQALRPALNARNAMGYLFAFGHPRPLMEMVQDGYILLELFFSSPEASVLRYGRDAAGQAVPVLAVEPEPGGRVRREAIIALEAACLREFDALDAILDGAWPETIDPGSALLDLERLLTRPTAQDVAEINAIPFIHGMAGAHNAPAVRPVPVHEWLLRPMATLRRIERAPWRAGSARSSLPWPIPSMTVRDLRYRVERIGRILRRA